MLDLFIAPGHCAPNLPQYPGIEIHPLAHPVTTSETVADIIARSHNPLVAVYFGNSIFEPDPNWAERVEMVHSNIHTYIYYSDYRTVDAEGHALPHPVIDYQVGSLRDDFDFGPMLIFDGEALRNLAGTLTPGLKFSALYELRLRLASPLPLRIPETLYSARAIAEPTGASQFDYVSASNADRQAELEQTFLKYLREHTDYYLSAPPAEADASGDFPVEISVIIPVRNRVRTIADAIQSALSQSAPFSFNVIVVDNHSTDGTTEAIAEIAALDPRVVHVIPEVDTLGIGGCWHLAVHHPDCGRYCVQLDSDDIYSGNDTLVRIHDKFVDERAGMVVGSYMLVDFNLQPIPPGLIAHREWTPLEGRNNLLRVNGIGAPRAFCTNVIRRTPIPNTSYGEDYAIALHVSAQYRVGRIFDNLYYCRRWDGNSDANLSLDRLNTNNRYKDFIRTLALSTRRNL